MPEAEDDHSRVSEIVKAAEKRAWLEVLKGLTDVENRVFEKTQQDKELTPDERHVWATVALRVGKLKDAELRTRLEDQSLPQPQRIQLRAQIGSIRRAIRPRGPGLILPAVIAPLVFFDALLLGANFVTALLIALAVAVVLLATSAWCARR
jgi:hypothetical protein